jgi:hypothetical protein
MGSSGGRGNLVGVAIATTAMVVASALLMYVEMKQNLMYRRQPSISSFFGSFNKHRYRRLEQPANGKRDRFIFFDMDDTLVATTKSDQRAYELIKETIRSELARLEILNESAPQKGT